MRTFCETKMITLVCESLLYSDRIGKKKKMEPQLLGKALCTIGLKAENIFLSIMSNFRKF